MKRLILILIGFVIVIRAPIAEAAAMETNSVNFGDTVSNESIIHKKSPKIVDSRITMATYKYDIYLCTQTTKKVVIKKDPDAMNFVKYVDDYVYYSKTAKESSRMSEWIVCKVRATWNKFQAMNNLKDEYRTKSIKKTLKLE